MTERQHLGADRGRCRRDCSKRHVPRSLLPQRVGGGEQRGTCGDHVVHHHNVATPQTGFGDELWAVEALRPILSRLCC